MKLNKILAETYYTAAEARKVLGLDETAFQYWGVSGRITRTYLPGRKQPVYPKKEIDGMARKIEASTITERAEGIEYKKATLSDLEEEYKLARIIFGRAADTTEIRQGKQAFLKRNPDIDYHLYDRGNFVACLHIIPLKHEAIEEFLQGKIVAWQINPKNVEKFIPGKPLECLMLDALTTPGVEPIRRSTYASRILSHFLNETLQEWGERGIEITKVYAVSRTPSGIRILKNAGFTVIDERENGRLSFELDISSSDLKHLRGYKEALKKKQNSR